VAKACFYNWDSLGHKSHAFVLRKIREAQSALSFKTKFYKMLSYKLAHLHYLVMEPGIIKPHEAPVGWGLLVREGQNSLRLVAAPAHQAISPGMQLLFLQRIAATASRGLFPPEEAEAAGEMAATPGAEPIADLASASVITTEKAEKSGSPGAACE
jgi:hypothetical protein